MRIHIDTDLGGDIDDICALAMVLNWQGAELVAVTTNTDDRGRRAGYSRYALDLAGRKNIPVASGADVALNCYRWNGKPVKPGLPDEPLYWPEPVQPTHTPIEQALDLLEQSIKQKVTIVAIGSLTNLALLEKRTPGILAEADLYIMGGYVYPPRRGFPQWGNDMDLARLIALQAESFAKDRGNRPSILFDHTFTGLPQDTINFLHDPLACAIALGWRDGVEICEIPLATEIEGELLRQTIAKNGKSTKVVTRASAEKFNELWLAAVTRQIAL